MSLRKKRFDELMSSKYISYHDLKVANQEQRKQLRQNENRYVIDVDLYGDGNLGCFINDVVNDKGDLML